jgi:methionine-rich copper-binding protein CopC
VGLSQPLQAGSYQVNWHVLSVDGHKTAGSYRFSVK